MPAVLCFFGRQPPENRLSAHYKLPKLRKTARKPLKYRKLLFYINQLLFYNQSLLFYNWSLLFYNCSLLFYNWSLLFYNWS
ncbi:MAG: hypothetical protein LBU34_13360, partial [Planctomycetaceae bacterium]|nr:hypothetical protein [Planctomycetaceae bacterium]